MAFPEKLGDKVERKFSIQFQKECQKLGILTTNKNATNLNVGLLTKRFNKKIKDKIEILNVVKLLWAVS